MNHKASDLMMLFESTFYSRFQTKLVRGEDEPIYLPACQTFPYHRIVFAHGYFSSALHEIAHWCVAGEARRQIEDYGYWYVPDGRDLVQQQAFEQVEVKPQALEWAFCVASGCPFNVSFDNLNGVTTDATMFKLNVYQQVQTYLTQGFPERAELFIKALADFYQRPFPLAAEQFILDREIYAEV